MTLHTPSAAPADVPQVEQAAASPAGVDMAASVAAGRSKARTKRPRGAVQARIAAMLDGTRTLRELADAADTSISHVWNTAQRLDRMGGIRRVNAERGEDRGLWVSFPAPVRAWLKAETPQGATVADLIRAIVQDAYDDAKEGRG
jgi:hypothetical protein